MFVAVLCGGAGTRLHAHTKDRVPKVLAPVLGRPFLHWKLRNLAALGYDDVMLLLGHQGDQVVEWLMSNPRPLGIRRIRVHFDPSLGMGLAMWNARPVLPDLFWLTYGDCLVNYDPVEVNEARVRGGWPAMQTVTPDGVDYGALIVPKRAWATWQPYHTTLDKLRRFGLMGQHVVEQPFWEINTPESLAEMEAQLACQ